VTYHLGKIINLPYKDFLEKVFSQKSYHVRSFLTFKKNDESHGYIYVIVCLNDPILRKCVRPVIGKNVGIESFYCLCTKKSFHIFGVPKRVFFVKQLPRFTSMTGPTQTPKNVDHYICSIHLSIKKNSISRYF
jgi:hypothetical protein